MRAEEFCYWLKGFFELIEAGPKTAEKLSFTKEQTEMIEKHLKSVFQEKIMAPYDIQQQGGGTGVPLPQPPYTITCSSGTGLPKDAAIC